MAKYHWDRITGNPALKKRLMDTSEVKEEDEDAMSENLRIQLPDECREGALSFRNATCMISLWYAKPQKPIWSVIELVGKYLYDGDLCAGDDAGPFDDLSSALNCIAGPMRTSQDPVDFQVWSERPIKAPTLRALAKQLIEGDRVSINGKTHIMTQGKLKKV